MLILRADLPLLIYTKYTYIVSIRENDGPEDTLSHDVFFSSDGIADRDCDIKFLGITRHKYKVGLSI